MRDFSGPSASKIIFQNLYSQQPESWDTWSRSCYVRMTVPWRFFLRYPHLSPKNKESFDVGCNLFAKFSAYIKNTQKESNKSKITFFISFLFFSLAGSLPRSDLAKIGFSWT